MSSRLAELAEREKREMAEEDAIGGEAVPIREMMQRISKIGEDLEPLRDAFLATNNRGKQEKIEAKNVEIDHLSQQCLSLINIMEQKTREDLKAKRVNRTTADLRNNIAARLQRDLLIESERQLKLRRTHDADVENQVARRVRVRFTDKNGTHKTPEECQKLAKVMVRSNTQDFLFLQARAELEDAVQQYHELVELQEDVGQLCQLVKHLSRLTQRQEADVAVVHEANQDIHKRMAKGAKDMERVGKAYK